jgi:hypothetical protein
VWFFLVGLSNSCCNSTRRISMFRSVAPAESSLPQPRLHVETRAGWIGRQSNVPLWRLLCADQCFRGLNCCEQANALIQIMLGGLLAKTSNYPELDPRCVISRLPVYSPGLEFSLVG